MPFRLIIIVMILVSLCSFGLDRTESHFIDEVMNRYAYFFQRSYLEKNPDLAREIMNAVDRKSLGRDSRVFYNRSSFDLPADYNYAKASGKMGLSKQISSWAGSFSLSNSCDWSRIRSNNWNALRGKSNSIDPATPRTCANPIFRDTWTAGDIKNYIEKNNITELCGLKKFPSELELSLEDYQNLKQAIIDLNKNSTYFRAFNFAHNMMIKEFYPKKINTIRNFSAPRYSIAAENSLNEILLNEALSSENKEIIQKAIDSFSMRRAALSKSDIENISQSLSHFISLDEKNRPASFLYKGKQCDAKIRLVLPNNKECALNQKQGPLLHQCSRYKQEFQYSNDIKLKLATELEASPNGFMSLGILSNSRAYSSFNGNQYHSKLREKAIETNQNTYLYRGMIHTLSGEFVHPSKITTILNKMDRSKDKKQPIERVQAFFEKRKHFLQNGYLYATKENWAIPLSNAEYIINKHHSDLINHQNILANKELSEEFIYAWANAIENLDPFFYFDGQRYTRIGGKNHTHDNIQLRIEAKELITDFQEDSDLSKRSLSLNNEHIFVHEGQLSHNLSILPNDDEEVIRNYHKYYQTQCGRYTIVNKKAGTFRVYNNQGEIELETYAMTGKARTDARSLYKETNPYIDIGGLGKSTPSTGAGIYYTGLEQNQDSPHLNKRQKNYYQNKFQGELITLINEFGSLNSSMDKEEALKLDFLEMIDKSDGSNPVAVHAIPTGFGPGAFSLRYNVFEKFLNGESMWLGGSNQEGPEMLRRTGGCINLLSDEDPNQDRLIFREQDIYQEFRELFTGSDKHYCPFYVLPEEGKTHFKVVNGRLVHAPVKREGFCHDDPNLSNSERSRLQGKNGCNKDYLVSPKTRLSENSCNISPIKINFDRRILNEDFQDLNRKKSMSGHVSDWVQTTNDFFFNKDQETKLKKIQAATKSLEQNKCMILNALNRKNKSQSSNEKEEDLKRLKLSDHEYNELAQMVLATMSVESDFCSGWKYTLKEFPLIGQPLVSIMKYHKSGLKQGLNTLASVPANTIQSALNKDESGWQELKRGMGNTLKFYNEAGRIAQSEGNSRGCSQIKKSLTYLSSYFEEKSDIQKLYIGEHEDGVYGLWERNIELDKFNENALRSPEVSAIVNFLALYDTYINQYKGIKKYQSDNNQITMIDSFKKYFYYLYQGQKYQLVDGSATPHLNPRIKKLNKTLKFFDLFTDVSAREN